MAVKNPTEIKAGEEIIPAEVEKYEDETARREIEVNGKSFVVVATDPFGLWQIKSTSGKLPKVLEGQRFTSPVEAETEITKYLAAKG